MERVGTLVSELPVVRISVHTDRRDLQFNAGIKRLRLSRMALLGRNILENLQLISMW